MTNQTLLQQNIMNTLGLETLSDEEKLVFLEQVGDVVMEAALLRLIVGLDENQEAALEQYLETEPTGEVLFGHLIQHHKNFEMILEEEVLAFKEEALTVLAESIETEVAS